MSSDSLVFFVNGKKVVERNADPNTALLPYLRNELLLTGTKLSCGQGGCGACTIIVSRYDFIKQDIVHLTVNACLMPLCWAHGTAITTIEGIGNTRKTMCSVQKNIAEHHGSQCGFCTPGMVMSVCGLLCTDQQPTEADIEDTLTGNLCRCTGYRPIFEGFRAYAKGFSGEMSASPLPEIIIPEEFKSMQMRGSSVVFRSEQSAWFSPTTLDELLQIKHNHPTAPIAQGFTSLVWAAKAGVRFPAIVSATAVRELYQVEWAEEGLTIGAGTPIYSLLDILKDGLKNIDESKVRMLQPIINLLSVGFGSPQLRNVATVGGSVANGSRTSDIIVAFSILGCRVTLASKATGERSTFMDLDYLNAPRAMLKSGEIIKSLFIPYSTDEDYFLMHKQLARIGGNTIMSSTMRVTIDKEKGTIKQFIASFGGVGKTIIQAPETSKRLLGRLWNDNIVPVACDALTLDMGYFNKQLKRNEKYKLRLGTNMFMKFFVTASVERERRLNISGAAERTEQLDDSLTPPKGVQVFEEITESQAASDAVGRPLVHNAAYQQATGEAVYIDDMPQHSGELHLVFVCSKKAHAEIKSVDVSGALKMPGVVGYIDYNDIPGHNKEPFAKDKVLFHGHPILAIIAESRDIAKRASRAVNVQYDDLKAVITIEEAMEAESFHDWSKTMKEGDVVRGFEESDHVLEGSVRIGAQEHFYMETQACLVLPHREHEELEIFSSTQNPTGVQHIVAGALEIPANRVSVRTKRMGGGFGGKDMNKASLVAVPAALAAQRFQRPVRCVLDRDEDMLITGTRPSYLAKYKVGFSTTGKVKALEVDWFGNGGIQGYLTTFMMTKGLAQMDNCYKIPNLRATGRVCKTNVATRAAARGFGGSEAHFITEIWLTAIGDYLNIPQEKVREINMYREGDKNITNDTLNGFNAKECWNQVLQQSNYHQRVTDIEDYNRKNKWKKRGIAIVPVKMTCSFGGISKSSYTFNQAAALVHIYLDGTVLVNHHATEMGQGVHTKLIQVTSRALGIPVSKIHISETRTDSLANGSTTGASTGSDLNGMAIINACQILLERLKPLMDQDPKMSWEDLIKRAYAERVPLSSLGTFKPDGFSLFDWEKKDKNAYPYFTYGAGVTEVEVDCLTGNHVVLRTDIVMDVGKSLNPTIDIGQIEGAFVQSYGNHTLEQIQYTPEGRGISIGPGFYAIPGIKNIPREMNVSLLKDSENPFSQAVYSSKGIGEPPMTLAISAFLAIRAAVRFARADTGLDPDFRFDSPATYDKIVNACGGPLPKLDVEDADASTDIKEL